MSIGASSLKQSHEKERGLNHSNFDETLVKLINQNEAV